MISFFATVQKLCMLWSKFFSWFRYFLSQLIIFKLVDFFKPTWFNAFNITYVRFGNQSLLLAMPC